MPRYNYICNDCIAASEKKLKRQMTEEEQCTLLFEVSHSMFASKKELKKITKCPICNGANTVITLLDTSLNTFVRGCDWHDFKKNNRDALRRDMAMHQLQNNDPYASMRTASDKSDLVDKLRAGSKKQKKQKHFLT